jgi:hypothetical protein
MTPDVKSPPYLFSVKPLGLQEEVQNKKKR